MEQVYVSILSPNPVFADGLRCALEGQPSIAGVRCCGSLDEATRDTQSPAVLLLDAEIGDAATAVRRLLGAAPTASIVVLGSEDDDEPAVRAIEAGAAAFVGRGEPLADLLAAIGHVRASQACCSHRLARAIVDRLCRGMPAPPRNQPPRVQLTDRELEILGLMALNLLNKQIAQRLGIALSTVKNHVHGILGKLDVRCRRDALRRAAQAGLIGQPAAVRACAPALPTNTASWTPI